MQPMRHTISILMENTFGVLTRVAGMFSGRGYNIDSLHVAPTHDPNVSRMTIVTGGDDAAVKTVKRDMPKVGRNDPCPCGSGKKYKKCHGP